MCGCKNKAKLRQQKQAAAAARAEALQEEEALELVELGLSSEYRLPTKIAQAVSGRDVIITNANDKRVFGSDHGPPPITIRGHNAKVPRRLREQLRARVPRAFVGPGPDPGSEDREEDTKDAPQPVPA